MRSYPISIIIESMFNNNFMYQTLEYLGEGQISSFIEDLNNLTNSGHFDGDILSEQGEQELQRKYNLGYNELQGILTEYLYGDKIEE